MVLNDFKEPYAGRSSSYGRQGGFTEGFSKSFQDDGFEISNTVFDIENILIFDVRAFYSFFLQIINASETITVNYKVDFATQDTREPGKLDPVKAWFPLVVEKAIPTESASNATLDNNKNISEFIRASSKITFVRISLRLSSATPTIIKGVVSGV